MRVIRFENIQLLYQFIIHVAKKYKNWSRHLGFLKINTTGFYGNNYIIFKNFDFIINFYV